MNKAKIIKPVTVILAVLVVACGRKEPVEEHAALEQALLTSYVNPFIGTGAHGHTFPGAAVPFSMVQLSPDTGIEGWDWCSGYHYSDSSIMGFSHTHLSGTGRGDLLDILLMPSTGAIQTEPGTKKDPDSGYRSRFTHENESASPGYYSVHLEDYNIEAELTASKRVGFHKYTFPQSENANILIDLFHGRKGDSVITTQVNIVNDTLITGLRKSKGWGEPGEKYWAEQEVYFAAAFSKPFQDWGTVQSEQIIERSTTRDGDKIKAFVRFNTTEKEVILVKVAISAVSIEGAINNLNAEIPHWNFDRVKQEAEELWERHLKAIVVEGGPEQKEVFYTAMYHAQLAPYLYADVDGRYRGSDKEVQQAGGFDNYTVFSLWDTFRASHPLFTLIEPERVNDFINAMLAHYEEYGLLPVWSLHASETNCMIGYHSVPVIVDAYFKGIRDFEVEKAYEAMKTSAMQDDFGVKYLKEYNYIPADLDNKSVSKTLEYAFDDWCIAQMAQALGKTEEYEYFLERSKSYVNVFDPATGFMRGKAANGEWQPGFDPKFASYGKSDFIEGNSWQYSWFVPHDIPGLIKLMGGKKAFTQKLDDLFNEVDEVVEGAPVDITGLIGQYAHGNEPSHHVAYLYNYGGQAWKTQERVHQIITELYNNTPGGLSGNEDCGQMSAWYIFSALGFYPVNPASGNYSVGTPMFPKATIYLENGKSFEIIAENVSDTNIYVQSIQLNGKEYDKDYLLHKDIVAGGRLVFTMGKEPVKAD
ncbi:glycoside hydrolase family 92 protein [Fulvivirga sp. M361]|uniref:GH92 family glycosyl hydrolase n=1 Tax=Fulvivirga sp. M361 TaxID=2594266 RepID=UPI00117B20CF|nr:GH92 family glycosyl hydrolase [Fulvivirga sp. M361]TRX60155.1 glycoside hydrolase family 92 protein [Fulvivirga sp. M361]